MSEPQQVMELNEIENFRFRIKHSREEAEAYTRRDASKHAAELRMIRRALPMLSNCKTFLDAPCGAGRATRTGMEDPRRL